MEKYRKTKNGVICMIYNNQKIRSKRLNWDAPSYDLNTLRSWVLAKSEFHKIFNKWVSSGYLRNNKPSIDRIDDYKPYSLDNIQIVSWKENNDRGSLDQKSGLNTKNCESVIQTDVNNNYINTFHSLRHAARMTGVPSCNIGLVCSGERKTAGGFKWRKEN